ncbi:ATP-binding protein [Actinoplanes sp. NEAU-A12]|uniref:ATP-binding protein n=1 Tax=Actinoplanes sandaracinus TaxID=3045177 RepID=A0ABT6WKP7_9ACTN|nr:ATP-binding protein [Actinoplanes sandaracinus]MDI6100304.1 ATP-binding protein [Actinoplanes sandaracinus]
MSEPAVLFLTCGLPGSGKTTLARELEERHGALRLTADEWLRWLHPELAESELDLLRDRMESLQWATALRVLSMGRNVVLDWGLWAREERDRYRTEARQIGARVVLCLLEPSKEELLARIARRNAALPAGAFRIGADEFEQAWEFFRQHRPTPPELELFDPPP